MHYFILIKLTKKQLHTSCIEGLTLKKYIIIIIIQFVYLQEVRALTFARPTWRQNWVLCKRWSLRTVSNADNL